MEEVAFHIVVEDILLQMRDSTAISGQFSVVSTPFPSPTRLSPLPPCRVEGKEDEEEGLSHSPIRGASCVVLVKRRDKSIGARFRSATWLSRSWSCRRAARRAWLRTDRV